MINDLPKIEDLKRLLPGALSRRSRARLIREVARPDRLVRSLRDERTAPWNVHAFVTVFE